MPHRIWTESSNTETPADHRSKAILAENEQLRRAVSQERLVGSIYYLVSQTFDATRIFTEVSQMIAEYLDAHRCILIRYDLEATDCPVKWYHQYHHASVSPVSIESLAPEIISASLQRLIFFEDDEAAAAALPNQQIDAFRKQHGILEAKGAQILFCGVPLGYLVVHRCEEGAPWVDEVQSLLQSAATALGSVIHQTELREQERAAQEKARQEALRKNQYLASMTHELRSPVNTIISCASMGLEGMLGELTPKQREYMDLIHQSGEHLLGVINDLLDMAKIESGKLSVVSKPLSVVSMIESAYGLVEPQLRKKHQRVKAHFGACVPELIAGDETRLKQVLINLLSNAQKFAPFGSQVTIAVDVVEQAGSDLLQIKVQDQGPGISSEDLSRIFEPFEQAEHEGHCTFRKEGTGLGLSISRSIVEAHGGTLTVESVLGEGSTFIVSLPYEPCRFAQPLLLSA